MELRVAISSQISTTSSSTLSLKVDKKSQNFEIGHKFLNKTSNKLQSGLYDIESSISLTGHIFNATIVGVDSKELTLYQRIQHFKSYNPKKMDEKEKDKV